MNQDNYKKVHSFILDLMKKVYVELCGTGGFV